MWRRSSDRRFLTYNFIVRKWWVWSFLIILLQPITSPAATLPRDTVAVASLSPDMRAVLTREYEIEVLVEPHAGDAWTRLAKRVAGDAAKWEDIAQFNAADDNLKAGRSVRVPYSLL